MSQEVYVKPYDNTAYRPGTANELYNPELIKCVWWLIVTISMLLLIVKTICKSIVCIFKQVAMECENNNPPEIKGQIDQFDTLVKIVNQLRSANYCNDEGYLVCNVAFKKLEELAKQEMLSNSRSL